MLSAHRRFAAKSSCVKRAHLGAAIVLNTASTAKAGHTVDALVQRLGCCHCSLSRSPDAVFSINPSLLVNDLPQAFLCVS